MISKLKEQLYNLYRQKEELEEKISSLEAQIEEYSNFKIILKDKIYIKKNNLSSNIIKQLKELSSFDNPQIKLFKKLNKPTFYLPKKIISWEIKDKHLILPRGLMREVIILFKKNNINFELDDKRVFEKVEIKPIKFKPKNIEQEKAIESILKKDFGICVAYPGFGKTYIAANIIEKRKVNTLVVVNKNMLLNQWIERFVDYFGYKKNEIGFLGKGKNKLNGILDIATIQSLKNKKELIKNYSFLIVDECHHIPANSFEDVVKEFEGKYILGLSATPNRKDSMEPLLYYQLGNIVYESKKKKINSNIVKIVTTNFTSETDNFTTLLNELILDEDRNNLIIEQILKYQNRKILLLTDRIEHIKILEEKLKKVGIEFISIYGSLNENEKKEKLSLIEKSNLVLATTSYFGEGIDFAHLNTIILATPISYHGRLIQYLGRVGRGGNETLAIDILDNKNNFTLSAFKKRKLGYKELHYNIEYF